MALGVTGYALAGCGGSSDSTAESALGMTCAEACDRDASYHCPNEPDRATCIADCEQSEAKLGQCSAQGDVYRRCLYDTLELECRADGTLGTSQPISVTSVCQPELARLSSCSACLPQSDDTSCDSCEKASCCSELKALVGDPEGVAFVDCARDCITMSCFNACDDAHPGQLAKLEEYSTCKEVKCPGC